MARSPVPLEVLRIESPCHESWDAMTGDDANRFCQGCRKHVHNLSAMTRDEAERLICQAAGQLCVRFEQLADGTVRTLDYAAPKAPRGWRFWTSVGTFGALITGVVHALLPGKPPIAPPPTRMLMGDVAPVLVAPTTAPTTVMMGGAPTPVCNTQPAPTRVTPSPPRSPNPQ